nr:unnamed protein product [Callosobruchus chinensis]
MLLVTYHSSIGTQTDSAPPS